MKFYRVIKSIVSCRWRKSSQGACQPGCGPGTQTIYYQCVKHHIQSGANLVQHSKDCRLVTKPPTEKPCEGTCDNLLWEYSQWSEVSFRIDSLHIAEIRHRYNVGIRLKIR